MHVVPRHRDDGIRLAWPRKEPGLPALTQYAGQIRTALQAQSPDSRD